MPQNPDNYRPEYDDDNDEYWANERKVVEEEWAGYRNRRPAKNGEIEEKKIDDGDGDTRYSKKYKTSPLARDCSSRERADLLRKLKKLAKSKKCTAAGLRQIRADIEYLTNRSK
jgi:hypothetical protein